MLLIGGLGGVAGQRTANASQGVSTLVPETVFIPEGTFIAGSDGAEREAAYQLDEKAYGHSVTRERGWYDGERDRGPVWTDAFRITRTPITNRQYQQFVDAYWRDEPDVDPETWRSFRLIHSYEKTAPYRWSGGPPAGRENHPVVLVTIADARAYAGWLSERTAQTWRLPTELEWEKAARGQDGRPFPWGTDFDPNLLNTHDNGPFSTMPVGSFPKGASPYGALDMAGQVFEWTATLARPGRYLVKGGSWDDKGCGICRAAARHSRPEEIKHILIGFRLVLDPSPDGPGEREGGDSERAR